MYTAEQITKKFVSESKQ